MHTSEKFCISSKERDGVISNLIITIQLFDDKYKKIRIYARNRTHLIFSMLHFAIGSTSIELKRDVAMQNGKKLSKVNCFFIMLSKNLDFVVISSRKFRTILE